MDRFHGTRITNILNNILTYDKLNDLDLDGLRIILKEHLKYYPLDVTLSLLFEGEAFIVNLINEDEAINVFFKFKIEDCDILKDSIMIEEITNNQARGTIEIKANYRLKSDPKSVSHTDTISLDGYWQEKILKWRKQ